MKNKLISKAICEYGDAGFQLEGQRERRSERRGERRKEKRVKGKGNGEGEDERAFGMERACHR